jgi:phosphoribosylaminoimidazole-succinocarboxamide synthase
MTSPPTAILETNIPILPLVRRGKVRDIYALDEDRLLIVATDRISAFDVVLPTGIPRKGEVLTQLSRFWFEKMQSQIAHHLITTTPWEVDRRLLPYRDVLERRSMLVWRTDVIPIECVVRGYLAGSGWKEYRETGSVCGIRLPTGFVESARLPEPLFTPATKADHGHDVSISEAEMARRIGAERTEMLKERSLRIYRDAAAYALERGIILCDTKFEFGFRDSELLWIDEALTPDSSRFWAVSEYRPGGPQPSFDKQYVRDYLETIGWNKEPPAPALPDEIVRRTMDKYLLAYRLLTGEDLSS